MEYTPDHFLCLMATVNGRTAQRNLIVGLLAEYLDDYIKKLRDDEPIDIQTLFEQAIAGVYVESLKGQISIEATTLVKRLCFPRRPNELLQTGSREVPSDTVLSDELPNDELPPDEQQVEVSRAETQSVDESPADDLEVGEAVMASADNQPSKENSPLNYRLMSRHQISNQSVENPFIRK